MPGNFECSVLPHIDDEHCRSVDGGRGAKRNEEDGDDAVPVTEEPLLALAPTQLEVAGTGQDVCEGHGEEQSLG